MIFAKDFLEDQKILASSSANSSPIVSVVLPTYRRFKGGLLKRSITSVLSQTFEDFELLIIDDGSTDGSSDLIEQFRAEDSRVIHVRHEMNSGVHSIRMNEGLELAKGKYLICQFDDDLWLNNALEDLVTEMEKHSEPAVVVGRGYFHNRWGKNILPKTTDIDFVTLTENNRFPNNGVLFSRCMIEKYGMYDTHIGMRRLCDWDLWLRFMKHVPFVILDQAVSEVFESNPGAIGVIVPWDMPLFRYLHSIPRNHLLIPSTWRDYEIDSLQIGEVELPNDIRRRLYEDQIAPYYMKFRHYFPALGSFSATLPHTPVKTVLYTKQSYDTCNEVTLNHYDRLANLRGSYKSFYQGLGQFGPNWVNEADLLILMRTVEDEAVKLVDQSFRANRPVGLYLDDDLFAFHEYGPHFGYLAPGTPYYQNLTQITSRVDAVVVTNDFIASSVRPLNPRIIPHNNTIPDEYLPAGVHPRNTPQLRIGYAGGGYRIDEFRLIWDALLQISKQYGDRLAFEFWGLDISSLPALSSPVVQKPFTFSYFQYLESLQSANFDILLTPMLDYPKPRLGKSLIKYYETAAAGALGIFSDVPQYQSLMGGLTCLKAKNEAESWRQAICQAIEMAPVDFDRMRTRCLEHVREEFTVSAQIDLHEAALRAVEFHAKTRSKRHQDGLPRVMYVLHSAHFGGAELQLWRRLRLAKSYGIQPVVVIPRFYKDTEHARQLKKNLENEGIPLEAVEYICYTEPRSPQEYFSELERGEIRELLERYSPALVHTVIFIPSWGQICQEMNIPHVNTNYAIEDKYTEVSEPPNFVHCSVVQSDSLRYTNIWSRLLGTAKILARDMAPEEVFKLGQRKYLQSIRAPLTKDPNERGALPATVRLIVTGTFQERKQQLETIQALGKLNKEGFHNFKLEFYGYTHFFPDYMEKCYQAIKDWELEDQVSIQNFTEDIAGILVSADVLLSLSTFESFPGSIKDALAAGVLVVATPVGGISELIIDKVSGILCTGTSVEEMTDGIRRALLLTPAEQQRIVEHARHIARLELHPYRAANDLFRMYNLAIDIHSEGKPSISPLPVIPERTIQVEQPANRVYPGAQNPGKLFPPSGSPTSIMPLGAGLVYTLVPEQQKWGGIDLMVAVLMGQVSGQLVMKVRTPGGNTIREVSTDLTNARLHEWLSLRFPPIKNSSGRPFYLELSMRNSGNTILSIFQTSKRPLFIRASQRALRTIGLRLQGGQLYCRKWYSGDQGL